mmetsp:Transcript_80208/g.223354  ORF Transcript_80208/g.223354 Transcript_80208/m.223354 type:complete len:313 (+) Transcript_80208:155-1093(+)
MRSYVAPSNRRLPTSRFGSSASRRRRRSGPRKSCARSLKSSARPRSVPRCSGIALFGVPRVSLRSACVARWSASSSAPAAIGPDISRTCGSSRTHSRRSNSQLKTSSGVRRPRSPSTRPAPSSAPQTPATRRERSATSSSRPTTLWALRSGPCTRRPRSLRRLRARRAPDERPPWRPGTTWRKSCSSSNMTPPPPGSSSTPRLRRSGRRRTGRKRTVRTRASAGSSCCKRPRMDRWLRSRFWRSPSPSCASGRPWTRAIATPRPRRNGWRSRVSRLNSASCRRSSTRPRGVCRLTRHRCGTCAASMGACWSS